MRARSWSGPRRRVHGDPDGAVVSERGDAQRRIADAGALDGHSGRAGITSLTANASYPSRPAMRDFITSFECLAMNLDVTGTRVTGFIRAPTNGSFTFASDEVGSLPSRRRIRRPRC